MAASRWAAGPWWAPSGFSLPSERVRNVKHWQRNVVVELLLVVAGVALTLGGVATLTLCHCPKLSLLWALLGAAALVTGLLRRSRRQQRWLWRVRKGIPL